MQEGFDEMKRDKTVIHERLKYLFFQDWHRRICKVQKYLGNMWAFIRRLKSDDSGIPILKTNYDKNVTQKTKWKRTRYSSNNNTQSCNTNRTSTPNLWFINPTLQLTSWILKPPNRIDLSNENPKRYPKKQTLQSPWARCHELVLKRLPRKALVELSYKLNSSLRCNTSQIRERKQP